MLAYGIPTKEANAQGIKTSKEAINLLKGQRFPMSHELSSEIELIKAETRAILDKVFELGGGDLAIGTVKAFERGVIDIPFAPSKFNAGKILPARDNTGAIRFLEYGNLPIPKDIKDLNRSLLEERGKYEGRDVNFQMVIDDIFAVGKGLLIGRPEKK